MEPAKGVYGQHRASQKSTMETEGGFPKRLVLYKNMRRSPAVVDLCLRTWRLADGCHGLSA